MKMLVRLSGLPGEWWIDEPTGSTREERGDYSPNPRSFDDLPDKVKINLAVLLTCDVNVTLVGIGSRLSEDVFWVEGWPCQE